MSSTSYWPLFDLVLRSGDLELRPMREADLAEAAAVLPPDLEQDPSATRFPVDRATQRALVLHQEYWRYYGTWRPETWRLSFAVRRDGEMVGLQELEAADFPLLRTVDTASWLVPAMRGRGAGKRMRRAVLALAFGPLGAEAAVTSAWHDNVESLGVSRSIGYRDNGVSRMARGDVADTLAHLRMTRDEWMTAAAGTEVTIEGFDACRPLFGLNPGENA